MPPVRYEGSPYHKRYPSPWGAPGLQTDKTECPSDVPAQETIRVLSVAIETAIQQGQCSLERDGAWPRYAWGRSPFVVAPGVTREIVWEARLTNSGAPSYKAYPVSPKRHNQLMPAQVRMTLWPQR